MDPPDEECVVCMDRRPNARLVPCGHSCYCHTCALQLHGTCAMCRQAIESVVVVPTGSRVVVVHPPPSPLNAALARFAASLGANATAARATADAAAVILRGSA